MSRVYSEGDYSEGARMRFAFSGHWRYIFTPSLRFQFSPGFTWAHYDDEVPAPFRDLNFPQDSTKQNYLTLIVPMTAQLHFTSRRGAWLYYVGGGPGLYRVWIENRRKVLEDPVTHDLHRGLYLGGTGQLGAEHFLKTLPSTSIEVMADGHYIMAQRDEQFPSGWNNKILNIGVRVGVNYYFHPNPPKKAAGVPGVTPTP